MTDESHIPGLDTMAGQLLDELDDAVLAELAGLFERVDPVPAGLVERVGFTLTMADLEMELARLTMDAREPVGARGEERARTVTFASDSLTVMVTVTPRGIGTCRLDGWLAPGGALRVELRSDRGNQDTNADSDGRFEFEQVPVGLVQLVLHPTDGSAVPLRAPVVTPAVEL